MNQVSVKLDPQIKTYDIDIAGHVNNSVFIKWFEDLRIKLFNEHFKLPELFSNNLYPVVISTEIYYKKFLRIFDKPSGVMYIECYSHGIITLKSEIRLNGKLAASGKKNVLCSIWINQRL
jgi:acyl-CoA thioesterase FadM